MNEPVSFQMKLAGNGDIVVPKNSVVYTDSFKFGDVDTFAISYIVSCTGLPNAKIQMEQSQVAPVIENVADVNFAVPRTVADIETALTSKTIQHAGLMPIPIQFVRFKITEQTDLVTDTIINMWLSLQKRFPM